MVTTQAYSMPWAESRAALADDDLTRLYPLTPKHFYPKTL
jgi:hypothetical protein